ncbi:hypothetical protein B0T17DRAFT_612310 [Bombardia bombarda]|uniref:CCZ1/INTU/HSP4 first Longin domain-containing protein n=1 Tax=Bombardia bombarda TaxID=252184 RepID=A0AA39XLX9_9PEZI|nr:hypothetical protein B0T17DRAFT_612310 [Bombardia bombarda]
MANNALAAPPAIVPAQLGFLAIYNPSLGTTDETIEDQIVYYASVNTQAAHQRRSRHRSSRGDRPTAVLSKEERNERLRQIGLAQGMVEFGRSFSAGRPVDTIDTEKSRVVLHELEPGWWMLASVDLTRLPLPPSRTASTSPPPQSSASTKGKGAQPAPQPQPEERIEYSSREVKPATLLLRDLLRAHSVFLLHHASSLSALFVRYQRIKFVSVLGRYWDMFLATWNVLLHGNPACNVFGGIKIAACGELGIGVGEEERGSGEREVLEGLVGRTEGLVDLIVGKFGEADAAAVGDEYHDKGQRPNQGSATVAEGQRQWLGTGDEPGAEDGAIFLGVGALSRHSLRDITYWMQDLYTWGENAYGVIESPTATRVLSRRKKSAAHRKGVVAVQTPTVNTPQQRLAVPATTTSPDETGSGVRSQTVSNKSSTPSSPTGEASGGGMDKLFSYLKLGYGTSWSVGGSGHPEQQASTDSETAEAKATTTDNGPRGNPKGGSAGQYLIGLMGDVEENGTTASEADTAQDSEDQPQGTPDINSRILLRTITVELEAEGEDRPESFITRDLGSYNTELLSQIVDSKGNNTSNASFDSQDRNKTRSMRVVVYSSRPFIYIFLFQLRTDSLAWNNYYRSLHHQLVPLHKSLLSSTTYRPEKPDLAGSSPRDLSSSQIYDLIYDPRSLTIHSTIPDIPEPSALIPSAAVWGRIEALNTHNQILNIFAATRDDPSGFERTCKTSRGWWIVWNRFLEQIASSSTANPNEGGPQGNRSESGRGVRDGYCGGGESRSGLEEKNCDDVDEYGDGGGGREQATPGEAEQEFVVSKEIFLIRKASDHGGGGRGVSASYVSGGGGGAGGGGAGGWTDGASRLAQGIGVDTRRYIEGLLSLNR